MTQEELDTLVMAETMEEVSETEETANPGEEISDISEEEEEEEVVMAPPATKEHRVVSQLDDVTRDSEEKANEIFDALDAVMNDVGEVLENIRKIESLGEEFETLFGTLEEKFPHIQRFRKASEESAELRKLASESSTVLQSANDKILGAMDTMQYQDIHRQKIERVINIMRALSKYMSVLFEGNIEDEKRVKSAQHIAGDTHIDEVISNDEIEALIERFGGK
ncbi:chemotaxis protein [Hydrogenimonas sp.]